MTWSAADYGETWAAVYDDVHAHLEEDADDATALLAGLAAQVGGTRVLELGVGTGRIALRLASAGLHVVGVDASPAMLAALAAKPGGDAVRCVLADMVDPPLAGPFDLVLLAFNTLFGLAEQDQQVRCLASAARMLGPGGMVVVEAAVPQPWRFTGAATVGDVREDQVALEVGDHDPVSQTVRSTRVLVSDRFGIRNLPLRIRYAWPSEIDLMARLAGLQRLERWAGWAHEPFTADAIRHVSVYTRHDPPTHDRDH